jgi:putative heme-binding domain-containing protein
MKKLVPFALALSLALGTAFAQDAAPPALGFLMQALAKSDDPAMQLNLLRGINKAMEGRRGVAAPAQWEAVAAKLGQSTNAEVREQVQTLGAVFGSSSALDGIRKLLTDANADRAAREKALESLIAAKDKETLPLLLDFAKQPGVLRRAAIRGLATYDDPRIAETIVGAYAALDSDDRREAIGTLLARTASAKALVAALEAKQIPVADLAAPQIRQLKGFKDAAIEDWLRKNPALTVSSSDKQAEIARYKILLTTIGGAGDASRGRALFSQTCALCHKLFDTGADIGPELTGANRTDIDYLLQNILDPNALIGKDYQSTTVETKDGRILVGIMRSEDENALTLKTLAGPMIVPRGDVKSVAVSEVSMMPEGLFAALKPEQVHDLFAYLGSPRQVPMMITNVTAADFFNGRDFARWKPSSEAWKIVDGAIVGRGNAQHPESLISEMIAADFKLTGQLKISGNKPAAEIVLRGRASDQTFAGFSVSLGGPSPSNLWIYMIGKPQPALNGPVIESGKWIACEISATGSRVQMTLDGKEAFTFSSPGREPRTMPAFYIFGEGAELAIKDLKIEAP